MTDMKIDPNKIYQSKDIQKLLKISRNQVTKLINDGRLDRTKIGRRYMWTGEQVLRSLAIPATILTR